MTRYPLVRLYEEVAYLAYYLHWSRKEILRMEHGERIRWTERVATMNRRLNEGPA